MTATPSKETGEVMSWAKLRGWEHTGFTGTSHVVLTHSNGAMHTLSCSPSTRAFVMLAKQDLAKKDGLPVERTKAASYTHKRATDRFIDTRPTDSSWLDELKAELEEIDGLLPTLNPRRFPTKARDLATRRCEIIEILRRNYQPIPPLPRAA